jgi:hypothetical protein
MQHAALLFRPRALVLGLLASAMLAACGGHSPVLDTVGDGGPDAGLLGQPCQFDSDCRPPDWICGPDGTCGPGCQTAGCPLTKVCNAISGRCDNPPDGGPDGGPDAGPDGGSDGGGVASDTLCKPCTVNGDCHGGGLCVQDTSHTHNFCTQDCTDLPCPAGYACTVDRTGTKHQCYPYSGQCAAADGGTDGGSDGGVNDPNLPSTNPNGCGFCGACTINNDCKTNHICINGACAAPCTTPGFPSLECAFAGAILGKCAVGPDGVTDYCLPILGACVPLPGPLGPLGGDTGCVPSGTNPACNPGADLPPSDGANVKVLPTDLTLASEDTLMRDSQGRLALGFIGVTPQGNSYMGVAQSTDDGAHWTDKGQMPAATPTQSDPVIVNSKWSTGERMHYVWVGYTIDNSNPNSPTVKDMFMEAAISDDGGATWHAGGSTTKVTDTTDNANGTLLLDKPWIAVGPDQSLIFTFSIGNNNYQDMYARVSTDHGASWGTTSYRITNGDTAHGHNLGMPVFDPNDATGNTIYLVWITYTDIQATNGNSLQIAKSTDHGHTWSQPMTISAGDDQVLFEPPSIAIDGVHKRLYAGYVASPGSAGASGAKYWDAKVAALDISGAAPVVLRQTRVNDDFPPGQSTGCFQHIHCMVQTDPATGRVFAGFIDNRRANAMGGVYYTVSTDQAASWAPNKRVSDADFPFNPDHANSQLKFLGDYFGFFFDGTKLRFAWSDPRNGTSSQPFYVGGAP